MFGVIKQYFTWIRGNAPTGKVENYPILSETNESNLPGIFIIGDLTGIPLLKFAVDSGKKVWNHIPASANQFLDAVIIGAGPSGISCAIEASSLNKRVVVLESNAPFQTIQSYPEGKPIFAEPKDLILNSPILIKNGTKESLLQDLKTVLVSSKISIETNQRVTSIERSPNTQLYSVQTETGKVYITNHVIIAMGKSGDPNKLNVPGENLKQVYYRLIDPAEASNKEIVVVGGGDSAVEAAIVTSRYAKKVTMVYRGSDLRRPKSENLIQFKRLVDEGKIHFISNSNVSEIMPDQVVIRDETSAKKIKCELLFVLTGTKPPIPFLKKVGIKIQNSKSFRDWIGFFSMLSFASTAYFGKASFYGIIWYSYVASASAFLFTCSSLFWGLLYIKQSGLRFSFGWKIFRNIYFIFASIYFLFIYFSASYFDFLLFNKYPAFHYTLLYTLTIVIFGIRRMYIRPTTYIKLQTVCLIFFQVFFLFLLPEIILPYLGKLNLLGSENGFIQTQMFPQKSYWKAYGFILAWPLNLGVLYDGSLTLFWLLYSLTLSFLVIPVLVWKYGKGAYCGWICSCGGLAETLGDEHRAKMPHGESAYRWEHSGQWILLIAFVLTLAKLVGAFGKSMFPSLEILEISADVTKGIYDLIVDIGLAGVIGVGCYFLFSGRIWCRMFCPLASLMHIYAKFSRFRIFSDKKKCISCNICTSNCHQGIDVMGYASRGLPMDSVQCVRCSACVSLCPTNVLSFGQWTGQKVVKDNISAVLE